MASDYEKRDKRKTAAAEDAAISERRQADAAERSAAADELNAQANAHMAAGVAQGAMMQGEAALMEAEAKSAAVAREAAAKEALMEKQGEAAIASSVGQLSDAGVSRVDTYEKQKEDRVNVQAIFDKIGNCLACIEQKGKSTEHFNEVAYAPEQEDGEKKDGGVSFAYRYHNLTAAIGQLIDLREEVQRIRGWDANQSREDTLERIKASIAEAKKIQAKTAKKTVNIVNAARKLWTNITIGVAAVSTIGFAIGIVADEEGGYIAGGIALFALLYTSMPLWGDEGKGARPLGWEDMIDIAEDGDDDDL